MLKSLLQKPNCKKISNTQAQILFKIRKMCRIIVSMFEVLYSLLKFMFNL